MFKTRCLFDSLISCYFLQAAAMPPVLTTSSGNYDYDYDSVQPYFLCDGEDEDFYPPPFSQLQPGPSEDIWKKFELLQTPPLSPSHRPPVCDAPRYDSHPLDAVSDLLEDECDPSHAYLQSFIIQDCMWSSSFTAAAKLERVVSERLASLRTRRDAAAAATDQQEQVNPAYLQDLHAATSCCIDPSALFPCSTANENQPATAFPLDAPRLADSQSEEEEEEDDEEEEDEEKEEEDEDELDVVTVERWRMASERSDAGIKPLVLKCSHVNTHQHNYAALQPTPERHTVKRIKSEAACGGWSPPRLSPLVTEDGGNRRRTHNVLEKQRRKELQLSFQTLRQQIPAVAQNQKAAKVLILKKATECIMGMRADEQRLMELKEELRKRSRKLKIRLKRSS
ncbi:hypothetical protein LDENG_00186720 [Lucifuga dentata]|nr:hypothetical protein LDENG_00186720 [Lucifuga dentata]